MRRDAGIELARIFAMLLIIIMHINTQGGLAEALVPMSLHYTVAWYFLCITYCAVNLFAIISGYVGACQEKFRYSRILPLWLSVVFYTILVTACFAVFRPGTVDVMDFIKAVTPASSGTYWFFSAYFAMFFLMPFMNYLLRELDEKQIKILGWTILIVFSVIPTLRHTDPWVTDRGYSTIWLMCMYMLGGSLRRLKLLERKGKRFWGCVFLICSLVAWGSKILLEYVMVMLTGELRGGGLLVSYLSPLMVLEAIAALGFFVNCRVKNQSVAKVIVAVSATAFSVYILHEQPFIKHYFIKGRFAGYAEQNVAVMVLLVLGTAAAVFGICAAIDMIRIKLFQVLHIRELSIKLCAAAEAAIQKRGILQDTNDRKQP